MLVSLHRPVIALAIGLGVMSAAAAQTQRPTLVVMPTQYMSADAQSAALVTNELAYQFKRQGYQVVSKERSQTMFHEMGLKTNQPYSDKLAAEFGRRLGADLVVYPQLLAAGAPLGRVPSVAHASDSGAVLHMRVLNANSGGRLYSRQVRKPLRVVASRAATAAPPRLAAAVLANGTTALYFERVAGSRQEIGGKR